jgi:hypothetical protein
MNALLLSLVSKDNFRVSLLRVLVLGQRYPAREKSKIVINISKPQEQPVG